MNEWRWSGIELIGGYGRLQAAEQLAQRRDKPNAPSFFIFFRQSSLLLHQFFSNSISAEGNGENELPLAARSFFAQQRGRGEWLYVFNPATNSSLSFPSSFSFSIPDKTILFIIHSIPLIHSIINQIQ